MTVQCLESLEKAGGDFFTVVVDNGSTDDSVRVLTDACARCREHQAYLLQLDDNYGFAGGNNRGIEYARGFNPDSYLLLNNDTEADPDFMVRLQSFARARPCVIENIANCGQPELLRLLDVTCFEDAGEVVDIVLNLKIVEVG